MYDTYFEIIKFLCRLNVQKIKCKFLKIMTILTYNMADYEPLGDGNLVS